MNNNLSELSDVKNIIEAMKNDPDSTDRLRKEVLEKGLEPKIREFERQYGDKIQDIIRTVNAKGEMTDEEKARMIMDMKRKLPKDSRRQLSAVISAMKNYMKNN